MTRQKKPYDVKVHESAWRTIKAIALEDKALAGKIIQRIEELGLDPVPNDEECSSKIVANLKKEKIDVRRLRCLNIKDYRIFYGFKKSGFICVYAVVYAKGSAAHGAAYDEESEHYQFIKLLYKFWKECQ